MKEFSKILQLLADGYFELSKQAKMKDAVEHGVETLVSASKKIPSVIFVLFAPTLSYLIGTTLLIYALSKYLLTKVLEDSLSLGITGASIILIGGLISFFFHRKLNAMAPEEKKLTKEIVATTKVGPVNDLLTQFSKEQNEIMENIVSKFR